MAQLFKVRWPGFAWIEAALFFPVAVMTTGELMTRAGGDAAAGSHWLLATIVAAVLFLVLMVAVDRLLIAFRGFAFLAFFATIVWASAVLVLSARLELLLPPNLAAGPGWMSFRGVATLTTMAVALLVHLRIFWIGLCDTGFAAGRLGVELKSNKAWRAQVKRYRNDRPRLPSEAGNTFWSWSELADDIKALFRKLTESLALQVLVGCTMGILLIAGGVVYYAHRNGNDAPPGPAQTEATRDAAPEHAAPPGTRVFSTRDSEGSGQRASDGRYVFDVTVNDTLMQMRYDDDIPLVTLRAEDALRLGISFGRLDFSTKIKTAKGLVDVAGITINTMTIGKITYRLVPGYVAKAGALDDNILGHSFLGRLAAYRVETNRLILIDRQGQSEVMSSVVHSSD
jgi:clan AA aspartic protease (TIGR02281 family)